MKRLLNILLLLGVVGIFSGASLKPSVSTEHSSIQSIDNRWLVVLKKLVEENSGSNNLEGLEKNRKILIEEFEKIGFVTTTHEVGGGHKVLSFQKKGANPDVALIGHIDTVFEMNTDFRVFTVEKEKIKGPGVIDMKGGLVLMMNLLDQLNQENPEIVKKIRVIINDDEETGSTYSKEKLIELTKGLSYGMVFEPGLENGNLVTSQLGVNWIQIDVKGRAAHAGLEPEKGVNACTELSNKIIKLERLMNYQKGPFINPGVIEGGSKPNVICDRASVKVDIRFVDDKQLENTYKKIRKIVATSTVYNEIINQGTTASLQKLAALPSMPESATKDLFALAQKAGLEIGQTVKGQRVGYGSDANHLSSTGLKLLVGVGPYGGKMHTEEEFMLVSAYKERFQLNYQMMTQILKEE
ncbi:M20/M25/M40 family metallo-hydrolase [Bacillus sp. FSL R12-0069]|uniref:M20/M25/M40 family metallo-hydrolase n=1 Tax=Bacillus sp. FSL R12-0069 TaxID=2975342 RepID=UPI0030F9AD99